MTNNNSARFANRDTVINGLIIDIENMTKEEFSITVPYVRSIVKAEQIARELLNVSEDTIIKINEVVNKPPKPIKYNDSKIYDYAYNRFDTEEEALEAAKVDGTEVKVVTWYEIGAQIWFIGYADNYGTEYYADETPINMTKTDQREFLRMSYADFAGAKVLGLHDVKKTEKKIYCVITSDNLAKCIEQ